MKLKLIIGEKEPKTVYKTLKERLDGGDYEIVAVADDGQELLCYIDTIPFDIVITEINLPIVDGLEVVRRKKNEHVRCDFIVMGESENFQDAYRAIKCGVSDFLVKPMSREAIFSCLWSAMSRQFSKISQINDSETALRAQYIGNVEKFLRNNMSMEATNRHWCTRFKEGAFQCMFIKLDCLSDVDSTRLSVSDYSKAIRKTVLQDVSALCFDVLFESRFDGLMVYMNYNRRDEEHMRCRLRELQPKLQKEAHFRDGIIATLCISDVVYDYAELIHCRSHAFAMVWVRMVKGTNGVLFYRTPTKLSPKYQEKIYSLSQKLHSASVTLNFDDFQAGIQEVFRLPTEILIRIEVRNLIRETENNFFNINEEMLKLLTGVGIKNHMDEKLKLALTLGSYQKILLTEFQQIFECINKNANRRGLVVRRAEQYVMEHYNQKISVDDVAESLMLSPAYFSTVYKSFTGKNFTDYIIEYRLNIAKNLLANTRMNVGEIANSLGYSDVRYFSRVFRKYTSQKPTEYRKKHLG